MVIWVALFSNIFQFLAISGLLQYIGFYNVIK